MKSNHLTYRLGNGFFSAILGKRKKKIKGKKATPKVHTLFSNFCSCAVGHYGPISKVFKFSTHSLGEKKGKAVS